jgi:hypothetical protein
VVRGYLPIISVPDAVPSANLIPEPSYPTISPSKTNMDNITVTLMNLNILQNIQIILRMITMSVIIARNEKGYLVEKKDEIVVKNRLKNPGKVNVKIAGPRTFNFMMTVQGVAQTVAGPSSGQDRVGPHHLDMMKITAGVVEIREDQIITHHNIQTKHRLESFIVRNVGCQCGIFLNTSSITVITVKNTNKNLS